MRRESLPPRHDWPARMDQIGFTFHSMGGRYWDESACYVFTAAEIDLLESVTQDVHQMCLAAIDHIIEHQLFHCLAIPQRFLECITTSWLNREPSMYGRLDFCYDGTHPPKLLEYNADTPTALLEASVAQWFWLQDVKPGTDQFNSVHEKLISRWLALRSSAPADTLYLASVRDSEEDYVTVQYMRDTAEQAGWRTKYISIEDIGW